MKQISQKMLRQRKFLMVLPLLVLPFLTMAFWALGGGKNAGASAEAGASPSGLNPDLPGASLKEDKALDKMGYYDKAATDSLKLLEQMKNDPYFTRNATGADSVLDALTGNIGSTAKPVNSGTANRYAASSSTYADPNEAKVYAKLGQLNAAMKEAATGKEHTNNSYRSPAYNPVEMERLEQSMQAAGNPSINTPDPEMKQLNGMLEKILDIQHPERLADKGKPIAENKAEVFAVSSMPDNWLVGLLDTGKSVDGSDVGFYGVSDDSGEAAAPNAIEAVVHETQTLVNGAIVKLRLLAAIYVNGQLIPKDNFVFGTVSLNNERLEVNINSIRYGQSLYPVKLEVYDMDGMAGIHIPGAISRDVAKQSTDNALQSVALSNLDPSIGAQAASAGIETAKSLLSKKVKLVKVMVKAGYKVLLKSKGSN